MLTFESTPHDTTRRILSLLLAQRHLSRTELARLTNQNKPTISHAVAGLIERGLVREVGSGASTGGRRPILLEIESTSSLVAGVEIEASHCKILLVTLTGEVVGHSSFPVVSTDVVSVVESIAWGVGELMKAWPDNALLGCGVAIPGLVDRVNDTVDLPPPFEWEAVPLRGELAKRLNSPVFLTDRGKASGLGEMWALGPEGTHDLIYLYLGGGVGGAVVLGHEIHWGVSSIAGEIGHMTVDPTGPQCSCGSRGCLESLVSTNAILRRYHQLAAATPPAIDARASRIDKNDLLTIPMIGEAATQDDPLAISVVEATARWISIAIANMLNILNPAAIVLGGPTACWGELLRGAIEREVEQWALPLANRSASIVIGQAGDLATPLGASVLVLQRAPELLARPTRINSSRAQ